MPPINKATLDDPEKVEALERIVPLGRMGEPSEVAEVLVSLSSKAASHVSGSTHCVDGGMVRHAPPP